MTEEQLWKSNGKSFKKQIYRFLSATCFHPILFTWRQHVWQTAGKKHLLATPISSVLIFKTQSPSSDFYFLIWNKSGSENLIKPGWPHSLWSRKELTCGFVCFWAPVLRNQSEVPTWGIYVSADFSLSQFIASFILKT